LPMMGMASLYDDRPPGGSDAKKTDDRSEEGNG
jgi:hypothetical protein